jgi:biotin-(acetyl-CoA carboxylase) ligase
MKRVSAGHDELSCGVSPIDAYRKRSLIIGRNITIIKADGTETLAIAEGIADDGSLLVRYADGRSEHLNSGEVSLDILGSNPGETSGNRKARRIK